jgi:serine/threonine protein kinase
MNKHSLSEIPLPAEQILKEILRSLQFVHECGFLFRDVHPTHVMQNQEGNIVLLGLKRMKKFTDIKGRVM